jgi:hypothetical protein
MPGDLPCASHRMPSATTSAHGVREELNDHVPCQHSSVAEQQSASLRCQMLSPLWNYEAGRVLSWLNSSLSTRAIA